jgi:hypothetical protein
MPTYRVHVLLASIYTEYVGVMIIFLEYMTIRIRDPPWRVTKGWGDSICIFFLLGYFFPGCHPEDM